MSVRSYQQIVNEAEAVAQLGHKGWFSVDDSGAKFGYWLGDMVMGQRVEVNGLTIGSVYTVIDAPDYPDGGYVFEDDDGDIRHRPASEFKIID